MSDFSFDRVVLGNVYKNGEWDDYTIFYKKTNDRYYYARLDSAGLIFQDVHRKEWEHKYPNGEYVMFFTELKRVKKFNKNIIMYLFEGK